MTLTKYLEAVVLSLIQAFNYGHNKYVFRGGIKIRVEHSTRDHHWRLSKTSLTSLIYMYISVIKYNPSES